MRERDDLAGLAGTDAGGDAEADAEADMGATATDSVAACIWDGLWRQYAIKSLPSPSSTRHPGRSSLSV